MVTMSRKRATHQSQRRELLRQGWNRRKGYAFTYRAMIEWYELPERRLPLVPTVGIKCVGGWAKEVRPSVEGDN